MKNKRAKSYKLTEETKARIRIIGAQSGLTDDEVVEKAVDLLYSITPADRDARMNLDIEVERVTEIINADKVTDESEGAQNG